MHPGMGISDYVSLIAIVAMLVSLSMPVASWHGLHASQEACTRRRRIWDHGGTAVLTGEPRKEPHHVTRGNRV